MHNRAKRQDSTYTFKGVASFIDDGRLRWKASLRTDGRRYVLYAADEFDAAVKYNQLAREHCGESARLNVLTTAQRLCWLEDEDVRLDTLIGRLVIERREYRDEALRLRVSLTSQDRALYEALRGATVNGPR